LSVQRDYSKTTQQMFMKLYGTVANNQWANRLDDIDDYITIDHYSGQ